MPPAFSRSFSGARCRSSGRKPVAQMIASACWNAPLLQRTPSGSIDENIGVTRSSPRSMAAWMRRVRGTPVVDTIDGQRAALARRLVLQRDRVDARLDVELLVFEELDRPARHPGDAAGDVLELHQEADRAGAAADDHDVLVRGTRRRRRSRRCAGAARRSRSCPGTTG